MFGNTNRNNSFWGNTNQQNTTLSNPLSTIGTTTQPASAGLFGSTQPTSTGLFGSTTIGSTTTQPASTGLFGSTTTQPTSTGLFGSTQPTSTGLFGTTQPTSTGLFGTTQSTSTGLFGSTTIGSTTTQPTSTGLFGSTPIGGTTGIFGTNTAIQGGLAQITGNEQANPQAFDGSTIVNVAYGHNYSQDEFRWEYYKRNDPNINNTTGGSLFGSTTQPTSTGLFGTTQPTSTGLFGSTQPASTGLFGSTTTQPASTSIFGTKPASTGLFGSTTQPTSTGLFGSTSTQPTSTGLFGSASSQPASSGLFGSTQPTSTGLFGTTQPTSTGLFGSTSTQPTSTGLFGSTQPTSTGLFGSTTTGTTTTQPTSTGLFGTTQPTSTGLFGSTQSTSTGLFGSTTTGTTTTQPTSTGPFGSTTTQPTSTGLFGSTTQPTSTGLFGSTQPTSTGLFGSTATGSTTTQPTSTGLFGTTQPTSTGLFGSTQPTSTGLFGSTSSQPTSTGLFGSTPTNLSQGVNKVGSFLLTWNINAPSPGLNSFWSSQMVLPQEAKDYLNARNAKESSAEVAPAVKSMAVEPQDRFGLRKVLKDLGVAVPRYSMATTHTATDYTAQESTDVGIDAKLEAEFSDSFNKIPDKKQNKTLDFYSNVDSHDRFLPLHNGGAKELEALKFYARVGKLQSESKVESKSDNGAVTNRCRRLDSIYKLKDEDDEQVDGNKGDKNTLVASDPDDVQISSNAPILTKAGYSTRPTLSSLKKMTDKQLSNVMDFQIVKSGCGDILWPGYTDLRNLNLDEIVDISYRKVTVYADTNTPHPIGKGLNKPAIITLYNCTPKDYDDDKSISLQVAQMDKLKEYTTSIGCKFISANFKSGIWMFESPYFISDINDVNNSSINFDSTITN